ncbi:MAG: glycosyltransferase, partial [Planctomycetes bacterium]|nr:glycosyltransferase [Planctomycetota bacterium]
MCWLGPTSRGGYRTRAVEEARLLGALGHEVDLAVFSPPWDAADPATTRAFQAELHEQTGAAVHLFTTSCFFDLSLSARAANEMIEPLARVVRERDIQIVHGQAGYAARLGLALGDRIPTLKVVFDCHGILPEEALMTGGHQARVRAAEQIEREAISGANLVVLVSENMGRHLESKYGVPMRRRLLLPCCVDLNRFPQCADTRRQARHAFGFGDEHTVVTYAGTLAEWQWPAAMFRTFTRIRRQLPSARLLLLVPEADHDKAKGLLRQAEVPEEDYRLEEVPSDQMGRMLVAGDAGLLLRQAHPVNVVSSPTKFGEYMAAGIPVIATAAVGDFSEWIERDRLGVVVAASDDGVSADAADRIVSFLEDVRANRQVWSARCRAIAAERLDWQTQIRELARSYRELLGPAECGETSREAGSTGAEAPAAPLHDAKRPLRVLFNGHDLKFARHFIQHFSDRPGYEVRVDEWRGHDIFDADQSEALLRWADVIFCEWCLGNARWYSRHKRPGQRLIVRLHHQEMQLPYRYQLEWPNVDAVIFINAQHYASFAREQPENRDKAVLIFNAIDCRAFDQPKLPGVEFNLGFVGMNPMRKRPDLAFDILARLRSVDPRYTLSFKTSMPWEYWWLWERQEEREFFSRFFAVLEASPHRNAVVFDPQGDNMSEWYSKIGFILSTSDHEGSHQAVAEGMAAACVPVIRDWDGATPLYPARFLFSRTQEAVELIRRLGEQEVHRRVEAENKSYARKHFDVSAILPQIEALFAGARTDAVTFPALRL